MGKADSKLGDAIRRFMVKAGFRTVADLAKGIGLDASSLRRWEAGERVPSRAKLERLAAAGIELPPGLRLDELVLLDHNEPHPPATGSLTSATTLTSIDKETDSTRDRPSNQRTKSSRPAGRSGSPPEDPVTEAEAKDLLLAVDVIRDPLHGDIQLTGLERQLIDTPAFQRLRDLNQLAPTYYVFPGTLHNRFIHSLGTLHVCSQMIETCNSNAEIYGRLRHADHPQPVPLSRYTTVLARLCALLHDTAHVPFGHILEKEGRVITKDEWRDPWRVAHLFGPGGDAVLTNAAVKYFERRDLSPDSARKLMHEVCNVLTVRKKQIASLPFPFVHDLVGNTICADLIDYVMRDSYFAGLRERFGDRFLRYLAVLPIETPIPKASNGKRLDGDDEDEDKPPPAGKAVLNGSACVTRSNETGTSRVACRLVLLPYRYNERRDVVEKHDVIAEAIDLVRRRLAVAEKLYFHRTKVVASSMLISSAHAAKLTVDQIWELSDREVMKTLRDSPDPRAKRLGRKLWDRQLFKPIYRASYHQPDTSKAANDLWTGTTGVYARFERPQGRNLLETRLEQIIGLAKFGDPAKAIGSVSVYCPTREMNVKSFDMLVLPRPDADLKRLQHSNHPPTQKEIEGIISTHFHLWKIEVFVDPDLVAIDATDPFTCKLAGAIQHAIGPRNEVSMFDNIPGYDLQLWIDEEFLESDLRSLGHGGPLDRRSFRELVAIASREGFSALPDEKRLSRLRELLRQRAPEQWRTRRDN